MNAANGGGAGGGVAVNAGAMPVPRVVANAKNAASTAGIANGSGIANAASIAAASVAAAEETVVDAGMIPDAYDSMIAPHSLPHAVRMAAWFAVPSGFSATGGLSQRACRSLCKPAVSSGIYPGRGGPVGPNGDG